MIYQWFSCNSVVVDLAILTCVECHKLLDCTDLPEKKTPLKYIRAHFPFGYLQRKLCYSYPHCSLPPWTDRLDVMCFKTWFLQTRLIILSIVQQNAFYWEQNISRFLASGRLPALQTELNLHKTSSTRWNNGWAFTTIVLFISEYCKIPVQYLNESASPVIKWRGGSVKFKPSTNGITHHAPYCLVLDIRNYFGTMHSWCCLGSTATSLKLDAFTSNWA